MVKNSGGNKTKQLGRKTQVPTTTRESTDPSEIYALVTKLFGNGLFECKCADGVTRRCVIRGKFRGRRAYSNQVAVGVGVLIGLRSFQADVADLLEVYSSADVERLKSLGVGIMGHEDDAPVDAITVDAVEAVEAVAVNIDDI
jgi:initiation factor 1A